MKTEQLNEYVFSQMIIARAKIIARIPHDDPSIPTEEHILQSCNQLRAERDLALRVLEESKPEPSAPSVRFL